MSSQHIVRREVTEVEHKADEHKSNEHHVDEHHATTKKTGVLGKIAEVFSTGWMHTDVTGHPYDTRGLYGPTGVKFTPAPGEVLADGTKVKQLDDHSLPSNGTAGAAPAGYTPSTTSEYMTHGAHGAGLATGAAALGAGAVAATHHNKQHTVTSTPVVASTPVIASTTTHHQSKYIPSGANGFFARQEFRNELSKLGSRNRWSSIEKLDNSLHSRFRTNLREWYMADRKEIQQTQQPIQQVERSNELLQTVSQGEIRVTQLPRTMQTATFETTNATTGGWSQHATQRTNLNVIETHTAPIIDNNARVMEAEQRETIVSTGPSVISTTYAPMHAMTSSSASTVSTHHHTADNLSNRMAATTIGSHHHNTVGQTIMAKEQAFEPQLSSNQTLSNNNIVVGQTPLGPAGAPYKSGVDSKYVDLNATSTGDMHKDVTGFPYDTRGIAGPRGINADVAQAEKDMSSSKISKSS